MQIAEEAIVSQLIGCERTWKASRMATHSARSGRTLALNERIGHVRVMLTKAADTMLGTIVDTLPEGLSVGDAFRKSG
jgi:hypothetical protein